MKRRKMVIGISAGLAVFLGLIWLAFPLVRSVFGIRTYAQASYKVTRADGRIEVRQYDEVVIVETLAEGDFEQAGRIGFKRLFAYITGNNGAGSKIAMTAPVIADGMAGQSGKKIAMTAPVLGEKQSTGWRYIFILPADFTMENAPAPIDPLVRLAVMPKKKVAAIQYSGAWSETAMREKSKELADWLLANRLEPISAPRYAGYDPPWTLPSFRRNEVLIDIR